MKNRWGKGKPVSLSDLMKITPIANEILHLSNEMNISTQDLMWLVVQLLDNTDDDTDNLKYSLESSYDILDDEEWEHEEQDEFDDEMENEDYTVNVKISSNGRFPELGFKAGVNDKEDLAYFFEMIMEILDKLE